MLPQGSSYGSSRLDTVMRESLQPRFVDTVLRSNKFAGDMLKSTETFNSSVMNFPLKYQKGVSGSSFSGYDQLQTSASNTRVKMVYSPKFYNVNVSLPKTEVAISKTDGDVIDLVAAEMKSRAEDCADDVGTIFQLNGTGNGGKDFLGLQAIVDNGTNVSTIGGLSRTTYPTLRSTVTASGGTLTLEKVRSLYNSIADGDVEPNSIYTSYDVYGLFEKILFPGVRYTQPAETRSTSERLTALAGFGKIAWLGMDVEPDRKIDTYNAGKMYMLNKNFLKFYAMKQYPNGQAMSLGASIIEGGQYDKNSSKGFFWTDWVEAYNAQAWNGFVVLGGELITDNPRRHGVLTGIVTV